MNRIFVRKIHNLKIWPQFFEAVSAGIKNFELRKDDRGFEVGDALELVEYDPYEKDGLRFSGRRCQCLVTYKLDSLFSGIEKGYCILGTANIPNTVVFEETKKPKRGSHGKAL